MRDASLRHRGGEGALPSAGARGRGLVVGIDLGGTKVMASLARANGQIVGELVVATATGGASVLVDQLVDVVDELRRVAASDAPVVGVAVVGAGAVDPASGRMTLAPNLPGLDGIDLAGELALRLSAEVVVENDVNAAALGELHEGHGEGHDSFVFIAAGTGIGMGIVVDRRLIRGARGQAGEIGFLPFGTDPFDARNRLRGPLEEAVAGQSIGLRYAERAGRSATTREVFALVDADDRARSILDSVSQSLATAIVAVQAVLDPGLVVLGGGIGSRPEILTRTRHWLGELGRPDLVVEPSRLGERAGVVGAVHLAVNAARRTSH